MGYLACFAFIFKSVKSFPKDERIQILLEYFEMIQNLQDTCCNLARYQRKKTLCIWIYHAIGLVCYLRVSSVLLH